MHGRARAGAGKNDVYVQHFTASGDIAPGWPVNGLGVCTAFVAWMDSRTFSTQRDIYATHLGVDGVPTTSWTADGRPVTELPAIDSSPVIVTDGADGLYIAWVSDQVNPDAWAQHLGPIGNVAPS